MEARFFPAAILSAVILSLCPVVCFGASARTANFIIEAPTPELAEEIGKEAEHYRHDLAIAWLGSAMPNWSRPCPIHADVAPNLGAGGATSFVFDRGEVFDWDMKIQGSEERILDSVLPHEVTHTIFASYFRRPLPRWADEGACTTVEHTSERNKQQVMLVNFLRTDHGIAFDKLFAMKEYPHDVMPLYSEGYSLARFLIEQGGRQKFIDFVGEGMKSDNWPAVTKDHYGYASLQALQDEWLDWVRQGSPALPNRGAETLAANGRPARSADQPLYRAQSDDRGSIASTGHTAGKQNPTPEDQGWGPVASANVVANARDANQYGASHRAPNSGGSAESSRSVYEQQSSESGNPNATAVATSSDTHPAHQPEFLAKRDNPAGGLASATQQDHQVLLQWTRTE